MLTARHRRYFGARHYFRRTVILLLLCGYSPASALPATSAGPSARSCARLADLTAGVAPDEAPDEAPEVLSEAHYRARRPQHGTSRAQKHPRQHESALKLIVPVYQSPRGPWQLVRQRRAERVGVQGVRRHYRDGAGKVKGHGATRCYSEQAQRKCARLAS